MELSGIMQIGQSHGHHPGAFLSLVCAHSGYVHVPVAKTLRGRNVRGVRKRQRKGRLL